MLEWIATHRWWFLIAVEVSFWVLIIGFLVMRYGFGIRSHRVFLWLLALNLLSFLALGIIDYRETGQFSTFQVVVVVALLYSITYGPKDLKRLDRYIRLKMARWKGESLPPEEEARLREEREKEEKKNYGRLHARGQRRGWYLHLLLFLIAHFVFAYLFGWKPASGVGGWVETWIDSWNTPELFPFRKEEVNQISRIWTLILLIDGINSFYYTIFPKKKKKTD
ncbi:hypothetical protein [Kroppenstedtia eburnea]|uniref:Integral membrane protein n=1 Tax=Kroppenstedtia eburnea TaxID=714067 RepID=A0A1N7PW02_9BACL|nr:hypothetical protein [Kroppenstedtia eburnea]QKI80926.1 hypothetical protein GXN75_02315 [Kroppenstedtia eburnea]SIT14771.1 hypothetical protein SAMN05421790_11516 [Kroppenstedtia eburnea]